MVLDILSGTGNPRENLPNRVYHLIGRIVHRAFYLNAAERDRFVDMKMLYRPTRFKELKREWDKLAERPKSAEFLALRESFLRRMWNASAFMQTLKQHFTMSFNGRRERAGTMWEGYLRFCDVASEGSNFREISCLGRDAWAVVLALVQEGLKEL